MHGVRVWLLSSVRSELLAVRAINGESRYMPVR